MAQMNFGGVVENVVTREEYPLAKALETLKDETIAVIGYGVQGPGHIETHLDEDCHDTTILDSLTKSDLYYIARAYRDL